LLLGATDQVPRFTEQVRFSRNELWQDSERIPAFAGYFCVGADRVPLE
jgi:hypothetical protein